MKSITINGSKRESVGKKASKTLRNAELVPCVIYGEKNPIHFSAKELDFRKLIYTPKAHIVLLKIGDETFNAIVQDVQFHPVKDQILHVDFYEINENKEVSMNIPVSIEGSAPGVLISGGVLVINKRKLRVKALTKNLPDSITVDISELKLGEKIYTLDLKNDNFSFLHSDNTVICQVRTARTSIEEEEEELEESEESTEGKTEGSETSKDDSSDKKEKTENQKDKPEN
jgi:large subunit ribosomal protein L25